jgi:hypothetical protein
VAKVGLTECSRNMRHTCYVLYIGCQGGCRLGHACLWASALAVLTPSRWVMHAVERRDDGHAEESDNTARFRNQLQSLMIRLPQSQSELHGGCEWQPFVND